jgi:hypothetical protein
MFHTYVLAACDNPYQTGRKSVDFDRASYLMDRALLQRAIDAMHEARDLQPPWDATRGAQWVWDYYCERHLETYGEHFIPNVDPHWDLPPRPREEHPGPE